MIKIITPNVATTILAGGLALLTSVSHAAQVATDPGDYSPLPAGVDLGIIYYQHTTHKNFIHRVRKYLISRVSRS